ncbi:MAG TPA: sulfite exporter TauE/SafE family protein [Caulobacterales bacterium]|nr:sulfite exporter TauE/SafE family protein [Caulobacterales bacterium]
MNLTLLLAAVFGTSVLSGVIGMAGGLLLMGIFTALLPVAAAMVTQGSVQFIANGGRAFLHRRHIQWRIVAIYMAGSLVIAGLLAAAAYQPSKRWVFLFLGLVPLAVWTPKSWFSVDASKPAHALLCSVLVSGFNILAGSAGPLLDVFFVRTSLTRHQIVATKATTQSFSHLTKIAYYGALLLGAERGEALPPAWFFAAMIPISFAGTWAGGLVLDRLSDVHFKTLTRWFVTVIGLGYLLTAARLFLSP